ncbi:hypothetical protein DDE82_005528 [Stemphylium lycopersici]|nr:hypothetical protein DDE82_005528 [Stemphylium lycopersici]
MHSTYLILAFLSHCLLSLAIPRHERPATTSLQPAQPCSGLAPRQNNVHSWLAIVSALQPWWLPDPTPTSIATGTTTKPRSIVTVTVTPGGGVLTTTKWVTPSPTPIRYTSTKVVWVTAAGKRGEGDREVTSPTAKTVGILPASPLPPAPLEARKNFLDLSKLEDPPSPGDIDCHNIPPDWALAIVAIRPDPGQRCNFYTKWECEQTGASWMSNVRSPGFNDLRTVGLDHQILSWECWEDECDGVQDEGGCWENPDGTPKYG